MPRKSLTLPSFSTEERICCFCGLKDDNELEYGKFHETSGIVTHYYCLLFSSNMQQKGLDDEGILGFLPGDINKELKRGKKLACCYCKRMGATLGCCNTKCKKIFHFPCGLKAGSLHQYFGEFRSYCSHHRPKQNIDDRILEEISPSETKICYICYDDVKPHDLLGTIWAPCCKKNAWFHRTCVQQLAMSAGYFFKCPLCNNKNEFQRAMLDHGIFIPSQDASWELVPNAFQELLYRHNRCDAENCLCPKGREHTSTNAKWELTLCRTCGSQGIHIACGNLKWGEPVWECSECTSILNKSVNAENSNGLTISSYSATNRMIRNDKGLLTDDESSSDSDISVGQYPAIPMEVGISSSSIPRLSSNAFQTSIGSKPPTSDTNPDNSIGNFGSSESQRESISGNYVTPEAKKINEEIPPLTKKPRISETFVEDNQRGPREDSDDDIIVVSEPSRKETSRSLDNSWNFPNSSKDTEINKSNSSQRIYSNSNKVDEISKEVTDSTLKNKVSLAGNSTLTGIVKHVPIEIDLSDNESVSVPAVTSMINSESTDNVIPNVPELNIQITNVTSLAPEVFASVPEPVNHHGGVSSNHFKCPTGDQPVNHNSLDYVQPQTHEHLQIVRFDNVSVSKNPTNSVLYGLTIPGTNNTVPLIISPTEKSKTSIAPALQGHYNTSGSNHSQFHDNSSVPLTMNRLAGPKSHKAAMQAAAIQAAARRAILTDNQTSVPSANSRLPDDDTPIVIGSKSYMPTIQNSPVPINILPKPIVSGNRYNDTSNTKTNQPTEKNKLSYSVPLETVVNDHVLLSQPTNKYSAKNLVPSTKNSPKKITESPVKSTTASIRNSSEKKTTRISSAKLASPSKPEMPMDSSTNNSMSAIVSSPGTQMYRFMQTGSCSQNTSNNSNDFAISRTSHMSTFSNGQGRDTVQNRYTNFHSITTSSTREWHEKSTVESINTQVHKTSNIRHQTELCILSSSRNTHVPSANCDGDAGSGPVAQPTSGPATNTKSDGGLGTSTREHESTSNNDIRNNVGGKITDDLQDDTNHHTKNCNSIECSPTADWSDSFDRIGLKNKNISLRDLQFKICGSKTVKMTICDTYSININVPDTGSNSKYVSCNPSPVSSKKDSNSIIGKMNGYALTRGDDTLSNLTSISEVLDSNGREHGDSLQSNVLAVDSEASMTELSPAKVNSQGREELKENLDPVPPTASVINTPGSSQRKGRSRLRSGVNKYAIQIGNERQGQETVDDSGDRSNSRKLSNHDQSLANNQLQNSYNSWKENGCSPSRTLVVPTEEATNSKKKLPERRKKNVAVKSTTQTSPVVKTNTSDVCDKSGLSLKRPKYAENDRVNSETQNDKFTAKNHLVNNERKAQSRKSPRVNVSKIETNSTNNLSKDRKRKCQMKDANNEAPVCCKVSIDLTRIRTVLANKIPKSSKTDDNNSYKRTSLFNDEHKREDALRKKLVQYNVKLKSRSLGNLSLDDRSSIWNFSIAKDRKWKSAENLDILLRQSRYQDSVNNFYNNDNTRRSYKRKARRFEKHDCVR